MTTRIIGTSPETAELKNTITRVAPTNGRVLITGENGVGKELVAQALHDGSKRSAQPFVTLNCAAVPSELIESELFGHIKGAYTGAVESRAGKFEAADGGTLFLDEVGDMPAPMQAKLLRVLQTGEVTRVGAVVTKSFDVRVVAATNRDLLSDVKSGRFREDLYYRLNVIHIAVPPLRERAADVVLLTERFLLDTARRNDIEVPPQLTPSAVAALAGHTWPGNIRELQNVIERLVILNDPGVRLTSADIEHAIPGVEINKQVLSDLEQHTVAPPPAAPAPAPRRRASTVSGRGQPTPDEQKLIDAAMAGMTQPTEDPDAWRPGRKPANPDTYLGKHGTVHTYNVGCSCLMCLSQNRVMRRIWDARRRLRATVA